MTKASKVLTIALFVFSIAFFAVAGLNTIASTDWKARAAVLPSQIDEQKKLNEQAVARIAIVEPQIKDARLFNATDVAAITTSVQSLNVQLTQKQEQAAQISAQLVDLIHRVEEIRRVRTLRRDEVFQLQNQLGELRAQRVQVLAEARRLTDLLYQAQGTLERVQLRKDLLQADGASLVSASGTTAGTEKSP